MNNKMIIYLKKLMLFFISFKEKSYFLPSIFISFSLSILILIISNVFFMSRDLVSEFLVINSIYQNHDTFSWIGIYYYDGSIYTSNLGFQAFIFSIPAIIGFSPGDLYFSFLHIIVGFMFFFINLLIFYELKKRFSFIASFCYLLLVFMNPIFILNANNLYWMHFSVFIPLYVSLKFYGKLKKFYVYLILFLTLLFRSLIGFEYYSTVAISVLIPMFIELSNQRKIYIYYVKEIFRVLVVTIFAFLISFSILTFGSGSDRAFRVAITNFVGISSHELSDDSELRSSIFKVNDDMYKEFTVNWNLQRSLDSSQVKQDLGYNGRASLINYIDLSVFLRLNYSKQVLLELFYTIQFIVIVLVSIFIVFFSFFNKSLRFKMYFAVIAISFSASFSWPFLMPLHFYMHSIVWRGITDSVLIFPFYSFTVIIFFDILYIKFISKKIKLK